MTARVASVAVRCAAGDLEGLVRALSDGSRCLAPEPPYPAAGLTNPRCGRVEPLNRDRPAEHLLRDVVARALAQAALPAGARVGLVVGTSSGNVCGPWERWHRQRLAGGSPPEEGTGRDAPALRIAEELGLSPAITLCVACISGTAALAVAEGWLADRDVDAVVVAGVDALSLYVHAGFSGLRALASDLPRPFHPDRDGLVLGEGAAALVLVDGPGHGPHLLGTAVTSDAVHMTAPDRDARGATRALREALSRAGCTPADVDVLSVHGTATRFNDAMEATALRQVFGHRPLAVHGVKHAIGHAMGAAGAIEAAVVVDALRTGRVPPPPDTAGTPPDDPAPDISSFAGPVPPRPALGVSMSAAFGGLNAVAVFGPGPPPSRPVVHVERGDDVWVTAGEPWAEAPTRWTRADPYVKAGMLAIARLVDAHGPLHPDTALVLATCTGCRAVDLAYHERLVREGAAHVSRRAFTYTLPGAPLSEASIYWGLHGAQLAFVGPAEWADREAARWVRHGRAPMAVALWCEAPSAQGPVEARASLWRPR